MRIPSSGVPLGARSVGHYRLLAPYREHPFPKPCAQIKWCVGGSGTVRLNNRDYVLKCGQVDIVLPGMPRLFWTHGKPWEVRWFTVDGPLALPLLTALGLHAGVYEAGPAPIALFRRLENAVRRSLSREDEIKAGIIAFQLLSEIAMRRHDKSFSLLSCAIDLIHERWTHPDFNIKTLADALGVNRSVLSRQFHYHMGVTIKNYLSRLRVQEALSMVQHTAYPVTRIASACGFTDPNHLARLIRSVTGKPPRQMRLCRMAPNTPPRSP